MSNFLNNTIDLQKIYNEVKDLDVLIDELQSKFINSSPTIITFYYNGGYIDYNGNSDDVILTLQAEEGMTWAEWIESDYNTTTDVNNLDHNGNESEYVVVDFNDYGARCWLHLDDWRNPEVLLTDEIVANGEYVKDITAMGDQDGDL